MKTLSQQAKEEAEKLVDEYSIIYTTFLIKELQLALEAKEKAMYDSAPKQGIGSE